MRKSIKQGAAALKGIRLAGLGQKPTITAPDPIAFAAAAKLLG
jgi:hypothetical protein